MANDDTMTDDRGVRTRRWGRIGSRWLALGVALLAAVGSASAQVPRAGSGAPEVAGGAWINGGPLTMAGLRGRVVLVEFWTYG
jgi:hypothetical protein